MAELGKNLQFFNFSLPSSDQLMTNTEVLNQIRELNSSTLLNLSCEELPNESIFNYCCHSENRYPNLVQPLPSTAQSGCLNEPPPIRTINSINTTESKRPKLIQSIPSSLVNKFSRISGEELNSNMMSSKPTKNSRRRKRTINDCGNSEGDKSNEVIHVRARRGQATDSHSLAERMRREKINNKLKCLQEIVPGCHKEMGMTLMLDQIINYVHSLQSQIEYLSMELEAAFSGDGNFKTTKSNEATRSHEVEAMERWAQEQYGDYNCFNMTWPQ